MRTNQAEVILRCMIHAERVCYVAVQRGKTVVITPQQRPTVSTTLEKYLERDTENIPFECRYVENGQIRMAWYLFALYTLKAEVWLDEVNGMCPREPRRVMISVASHFRVPI